MQILVLNCGSSSVKFMVMQMPDEKVVFKGTAEKSDNGRLKLVIRDGTGETCVTGIYDHPGVFDRLFDLIEGNPLNGGSGCYPVEAVGHRLVHGGEGISEGMQVTPELLDRMRGMVQLAPLHYPANIAGIEAVWARYPGIFQAGVFDTGFHQTLPPYAFHYAIPLKYYQKYGIRKYGFHGSSHKYAAQRACDLLKRDIGDSRIITCHLGSGASVAAIKNGRSVDTSMGFTPVEGLAMGTRCGDLDPGVILYLMKKENFSPGEMDAILNRESGLLGISGHSSDIREILKQGEAGDENAKLAIDAYSYRIKKYIGAYSAVLGGVDILVFTGGVGENSAYIRQEVCSGLGFLGIEPDFEKNWHPSGGEFIISQMGSATGVCVIPSNEELVIARETMQLYSKTTRNQ